MTTGTQQKAAGIADVLAADCAPHRGYAEIAEHAITILADTGREFTAEDVRGLIEQAYPDAVAHSPNVLPAAMAGAAARRRIHAVGYRQATRRSAHARLLRVWTGVAA